MEFRDEHGIVVDDETYEQKAITAYLAKEISFKDLQVSLELSRAHTYRRISIFKEHGPAGLRSKKTGVANNAYPKEFREHAVSIVRELYPDFGPKFASEKLSENHGVEVSSETLRKWMKAAGLWTDRSGREPRIFSPRDPRPRRGELVQVDGSYHRWFEKRGQEMCLLVFIDDATSELMILELVDHENSYNYMASLKRYIDMFGRPLALYSDRHSIFRSPKPNAHGEFEPTQFTKACRNLDIEVICALTPQAKGRVERANRTLQDRLVKEMRLRGITTIEHANRYLEEYRLDHNRRFSRAPRDPRDAHAPLGNANLDILLVYTETRKVFKDLSINYNKNKFILENNENSRKVIGQRVTIAVRLDGTIDVVHGEISLPYRKFDKIRRVGNGPDVVDHKRLNAAFEMARCIEEVEPHHFQRNAHVLAGFRKFFREPEDVRSRNLRDAPAAIRTKHKGRPRAPLGKHPIVVLESRLSKPS